MRYLDELFRLNKGNCEPLRFKFVDSIKRNAFIFDAGKRRLDSLFLATLFNITNTFFEKYNSGGYVLVIQLHKLEFADKNVYMFLDLLVYHILKCGKFSVDVLVVSEERNTDGFWATIGFENTATFNFFIQNDFSLKNYSNRKRLFIEYYERGLHASKTWFRKFLPRDIIDINTTTSKVTSDVSNFLKNIGIKKESILALSDVVSEFVSNTEHNKGDCLLDINIYGKFIYISCINLFDARLFDRLKEKHVNHTLMPKVVEILDKAYEYHKKQFSEYYTEDDFYFISAFQNNITTKERLSGGTGLTTAFNALADQTLLKESYVLSGANLIQFKKGLMGNNEKVIGFNERNNYYTDIPNTEVIDKCALYVPGVVFQLGIDII